MRATNAMWVSGFGEKHRGTLRRVLVGLIAAMTMESMAAAAAGADPLDSQPGIVTREFIYESAPFPSCHASTIVESSGGLVAAWFGGQYEKHPEVAIYVSRREGGRWSVPTKVVDGVENGKQYATWNPVLFQPKTGPLVLFYKVGPSPSTWWGRAMTSADGGRTWSPSWRLPEGILGPVRNKPVVLPDGALLCGSSSEHDGWRVHMELTRDLGRTWEKTEPLNTKEAFGAIQPTLLQWPSGRVQILNRSRQGVLTENWMGSTWKEWTPMARTEVVNPNSGVDAVVLRDGRGVLIYNDTPKGRTPINVAVAAEKGPWRNVVVLENEPGEYSYPAVIQSADGLVHITYTWQRKRIRHVVADPSKWVSPATR